MIILGIDPGFTVTGYGIIKCARDAQGRSRIYIIDYGALKLSPQKTLANRIGIFHSFFTEKIIDHQVECLALETPFLGKNAQNFLKLGYLRGNLYLLADKHNLRLSEFSPREVKLALTGYGSADKEQVARVLLKLFPDLIMPDKLDVTDALAVSICGVLKLNSL